MVSDVKLRGYHRKVRFRRALLPLRGGCEGAEPCSLAAAVIAEHPSVTGAASIKYRLYETG